MNLLRGLLGRCPDAEDAWQETWFAIWRNRTRLRGEASAWGYIRKSAVRKARDQLRRAGSRPRLRPLHTEMSRGTPTELPALDLGALRREERTVLVLRFWEGLSLAEIAELVELPVGTVKSQLHRGRMRLRDQLSLEGRTEACHDL